MATILLLSPDDEMRGWLSGQGADVIQTIDPITVEFAEKARADYVLSYNYRHILKRDVLDALPVEPINLHISYLPWNRGADPNPWSWIDDTPKGVTVHFIDEGVDAGDLIAQRRIHFDGSETLAETYAALQSNMRSLFKKLWPMLDELDAFRRAQPLGGSFHWSRERTRFEHLLTDGWNTPVAALRHLTAPGSRRTEHRSPPA